MHQAWEAVASGLPLGRLGTEDLRARLTEASRLAERGGGLALLALELGEIEQEDRLGEALAKLAGGRNPFGIFGRFGRSPIRDVIGAARTAGAAPRNAEDWGKLLDLHVWRKDARKYGAQWNAFAGHHGLSALPPEETTSREALIRFGQLASEMLTLAALAHTRIERLRALFPYGLEPEAVVFRIDVAVAVASLRASLGDADVAGAKRLRDAVHGLANGIGESLGEALHEIADGLGAAEITDAAVAARWREIQAETDRLAAQRDTLRHLSVVAALVRSSGAPRWAAEIERTPPDGDDRLLPADWRDAWDHARATGFLARIADRVVVEKLAHERAELVRLRENRFSQTIENLTFLGLRSRLTENVLAALNQFLSALAKMPKSAGAVTAVHYRRILRDSLQRAVKAIPCWIMPEWRVAEQLPAELGSFDLVIIDEASQSNILALPVVLRGKKLLIVGDDKQVSPLTVGTEDSVINRLRATYLVGQPLAEQIDPSTSLYELGSIMYPGKLTVLLDHFRCVEPIIRFSSRFYGDGLRPLRLPTPSERIDPPLVDILVEDGVRRGEENEAEAATIVEEIRQIIADPRLNAAAKRSIGVISLHANRQAKRIYDLLIETVGPEAMDAHRIMCGDAATFQGQERDIVFLSMVHDAATATKQSSRMYEQRYNVALSRARDRMVLVRSVTSSSLKEGDIKLDVLRHFQNPMAGGTIGQSDAVLTQTQSRFEREFGKRLLAAGYRVQAQVRAGGYYIDFVVEGVNDRRLAIELDGDSFHGPDRWAHDVKRQKSLERMGWTFWRCWASEWEADKDGVFGDLVKALERQGIGPIGAVSTSDILPVEYRSVRHRPKPPQDVDDPPALGTAVVGPTADNSSVAPPTSDPIRVPVQSTSDDHMGPGTLERLSHSGPLFAEAASEAPAIATSVLMRPTRRVAIGDQVVVRYADGKGGARRFEIVGDGSADGRARIAWNSPLAAAILGLQVEDEGEFMVDGTPRTVIVERIREPVHSPTA